MSFQEWSFFLGLFLLHLLRAFKLPELHLEKDYQSDDACPEEAEVYVHGRLVVRGWREDINLCPCTRQYRIRFMKPPN
jgi:hypothetical protein